MFTVPFFFFHYSDDDLFDDLSLKDMAVSRSHGDPAPTCETFIYFDDHNEIVSHQTAVCLFNRAPPLKPLKGYFRQ
jgi:hypothetical protein